MLSPSPLCCSPDIAVFKMVATTSHLMSYQTPSRGDKGEERCVRAAVRASHTDGAAAGTATSPARSAPLLSIRLVPTKHSGMCFPLQPEAKTWTALRLPEREHTSVALCQSSALHPVANRSLSWMSAWNRACLEPLLVWFISPGPGKQQCWDFAQQGWHLFNIP